MVAIRLRQRAANAARFLSLLQIVIDSTRVFHSFLHCLFGDFMEDDALRLFETSRLGNVPCDSLTFTVGVGCEQDLVGLFSE